MFTPEGYKWLADWIAEEAQGGWIVVSDGAGQSEVASITEIEVTEGESPTVICRATFTGDRANFEWAKRAVKLTDGTVIDVNEDDAGRKVEGAVWDVEVEIEVSGSSPSQ